MSDFQSNLGISWHAAPTWLLFNPGIHVLYKSMSPSPRFSCSHYFEAETDSEAITVSLRQLYSPVRLYSNSLHPILQRGSQWPLLPSSKGLTFLPLFPRGRSDLKGWQGKGMTFSIFGLDGACPSRLLFLGLFGFFSSACEILKALMLRQPQVILRARFGSPSLSLFNIFSLWVCGRKVRSRLRLCESMNSQPSL